MDKNFNLYDSINTTAVRWLTHLQKLHCKTLGIEKFNRKNDTHIWFLHMLESYRVYNDYNCYYLDCNLFDYLYIRYIKKFKGARRMKKDGFMINVGVFINELTEAFNTDTFIIEEIYKEYWG